MTRRISRLVAPASVIILFVLAGCSAEDDPGSTNSAGSAAGSANPVGGSSGLGSAGAGIDGSGSGGVSAAGIGGAGTAGVMSTAGVTGAGATAGAAGSGSAIPATFDTVKLVFGGGGGIMTCAAAPCHGVGGVAPPHKPLELPPNDDQQLYMNLISYVSEACNNAKLVEPGNPAQSSLLTILRGPCGMTPRMPYGCDPEVGDCIPDEYIAAIEQWIAAGAAF